MNYSIRLAAPGFSFDPPNQRAHGEVAVHAMRFRGVPNDAFRLRGVLRDAKGNRLVGQQLACRGRCHGFGVGREQSVATTDGNGWFDLRAPLLEGDAYYLYLVDSDWVLQQPKTAESKSRNDPRFLVRWEETAEQGRHLALAAVPAAEVAVRVVDGDGRPLPFASTSLQVAWSDILPRWSSIARETSSRDGLVVFRGVQPCEDLHRVQVLSAAGVGCSDVCEIRGRRRQLEVSCEKPGAVSGRVVGAPGQPVAGVRISLETVEFGTRSIRSPTVLTDRDGRFAFTGVPPGTHVVRAGLRVGPKGMSRSVVLESGEAVDVELPLSR